MGEHSAPRNTSVISASGAFAAIVAGAALASGIALPEADSAVAEASVSAPTGILDIIAECESGGNASVVNASGHGGLFQFSVATWKSVGGTGLPQNASVAEQYKRAALLLARDGTAPWLASKGCWAGKSVSNLKIKNAPTAPVPVPVPAPSVKAKAKVKPSPKPRTQVQAPTPTPIHDSVVTPSSKMSVKHIVSKGDTLSEIAAAHGIGDYMTIFNKNRHLISNPDLIYPGQVLTL